MKLFEQLKNWFGSVAQRHNCKNHMQLHFCWWNEGINLRSIPHGYCNAMGCGMIWYCEIYQDIPKKFKYKYRNNCICFLNRNSWNCRFFNDMDTKANFLIEGIWPEIKELDLLTIEKTYERN